MSWVNKIIGGLFDAAAATLNAIFKAETRQNPELAVWTDDGTGALGLIDSPSAGAVAMPARPLWEQAQTQVEALQQIDPDFNQVAFVTQASKEYMSVFAAEGAMTADKVSAVVTPDFLDQFQRRIADWNASGYRRVAKDLKLDGGTIFKVAIDGDAQRITIRFVGSAVRYTQDAATDAAVDGTKQAASFTEFATFVRPAGSTTPKPVAVSGVTHCPACGAPAQNGAVYCDYCGTPLSGTGGTWLLDRLSASAYT